MKKKTLRSIYRTVTVLMAILAVTFIEAAVVGTLMPIVALGLIPLTLGLTFLFYTLSAESNKKFAKMHTRDVNYAAWRGYTAYPAKNANGRKYAA